MALSPDDRRDLTELCHRYASCADTRDFDAMGALFAEDAVLVSVHGGREGRDAIVAAMRGLSRYDRTFHLLGQIRHWVDDRGVVCGEAYCIAHHFNAGADRTQDRVMYIRYDDEFVRNDGVWTFARRTLDVAWAGHEDKPLGS